MQGIEYKVVPAPRKARSVRGARTKADAMARALEEILREEAAAGWEYVRADLIPCEEKAGFFSRAVELHRAMLVFRKVPVAAPRPELRPEPVPVRAEPEPYPLRTARAGEPQRGFAEPAPLPFRPLGSATD